MKGLAAILRPLVHYRAMSLAVIAGAAVATAVLAGALIVGDSVRGSLRRLTLERLGGVDEALTTPRFFPAGLTDRLAASPGFAERYAAAAPAILLRASAVHADSRARASGVQLQGVDRRFLELFGDESVAEDDLFPAERAGPFPPVAISAGLASAIGAAPGDAILIHLKRWSEVPRGSLLGRKDTASVVETLRLTVTRVLPDDGLGRFGLQAHQTTPLNAFVPLADLASALDQEGTVNAVLLARRGEVAGASDAGDVATADDLLRAELSLVDLGLELRGEPEAPYASLESAELMLRPAVVDAARAAADVAGAPIQPLYAYLANRLTVVENADAETDGDGDEREVPYSTVVAIDATSDEFPRLELVDGTPAPPLEGDAILLNAWAAEDLDAGPGDVVEMTYFEVGPREDLREVRHRFTVRGVVAMTGPGADPTLVQDYPGIGDSANMADWDPPFPVDLGLIRERDEDYWDRYRDAPKAFISYDLGRRLWRTRWGDTTAARLAAAPGESLDATLERFRGALLDRLPLDGLGFVFQPVKTRGLDASAGATDFAGLFLGFSFFLIAAAAMLVALLFRLGVEQRAGEIGLYLATGFPLRKVRRRLLGEGLILAFLGALLGLGLALAYATAMMHLLRTRWRPAVGTSELELHVVPATLALGAAIAVVVVLGTIYLALRRIAKLRATALLKRVVTPPADPRAGRRARWTAGVALALAAALLLYAVAAGETQNAGLFFAIGPLILIGLLAAFSLLGGVAAPGAARRAGPGAILRLAVAGAHRNRGRSLLATTLVATASFMIVTVAAFQHDYSRESLDRGSGAGGYALVAETDVALHHDPGDTDGRFELGLPEDGDDGAALAAATIYPCRLLPGEDTSCLNLYRPTRPRVVGLPAAVIERGGFTFQDTFAEVDDPWTLLHRDLGEDVVPAIGDANSMQYILKLGLGEDLELPGVFGETVKLRLVATLATSIFQSELLVAEERLLEHFPDEDGFDYFLIDAPPEVASLVSTVLERDLADYGFDAVPAGEKLAAFHAVQNTYLSTFRTLGGLGLLLGTLGLAIILLRSVLERRGELAAMRAFGFRRSTLTAMVVAENALLLVAGLVIGTVAALVTVAPHLLSAGAVTPWGAIVATLAVILVVGLAAGTLAAAGALRLPLLPALKAEG